MKGIETIRNARGAVAPLVAVMLILIIVCVALVVDLGHVHNVKVQLQRAVDAAALAAAEQLPDGNAVSVAVAVAGANQVDQEGITILPADVVLGIWDKNIVAGATAATRFTPLAAGGTPNAVKVTATRDVRHIFFFFVESTPVTTDAIAVNIFEEQTIPIALVSCIPTGGKFINIKSPGLSICDITTYEFHADKDDTAAWTSLTFNPASQQNILNFLDEDGVQTFNQVVYGTGLSHDGIENTSVETGNRDIPVPDFPVYSDVTRGCVGNSGLSISCGLGEDLSLDPSDPDLIQKADPAKVPAAALTDPLAYNPLPRWYHFDDVEATFDVYDDAFTRLLTQNGTLIQGVGESKSVYQTRLKNLYTGLLPSPYGGAGDARFKASGNKEKFLTYDSGTKEYKPNFNEVLRYAGYPPVWVNNGTIPPALTKFLDDLVNAPGKGKDPAQFREEISSRFEPFEPGNETNSGGTGETVRLTIPVIFAGSCDEWKALSTGPVKSDIKLYYIGTANFLLTRAWKSPDCFDHGTRAINIEFNPPSDCSLSGAKTFDPPIAGSIIQCAGGKTPNAALEGVIRVPTKGDEEEAGIRKIQLVE